MTNYKFKKHKLTADEKLWMEEFIRAGFAKIDPKAMKVKLLGKISPEFDSKKLDTRLVMYDHLTLLGIWLLNSKHSILSQTNDVIEEIRNQIKKDSQLKSIKASVIATELQIATEDVEIIFKLLLDMSFFSGAQGSFNGSGYSEVNFGNDVSGFDKVLYYKDIEDALEKFYIAFSVPDKANKSKPKKVEKADSNWVYIERDYTISKKAIGKKLNFIKEKYKREIIFRDIEQSYILMKNDLNKPAVILAGSVIEEILRLFLTHRGLFSGDNNFFNYIEICNKNKLLTNGISQLTDSVRSFRNLVHLRAEESSKIAVTKSKATGAVSAIFTIINDL